mmetsp:Transcript_10250/g.27177  ORF Transcript_10250/g.27177 Transcript_10250/m.27177 type:complete len:213 (-) Transcript_10250:122-760(-)
MSGQGGISVSQLVPLAVSLGLSKVDLQELGYTWHVEVGFVAMQIICLAALGMLYKKITAMLDDGTKLQIPEVKQFGQVVTPATEMTAKEHDMAKWQAQAKQMGMGALILGGIYYKWRMLFPLVMQLVMTPMQLFESPLVQVHFFGKTIERPFPEPNPFGLPAMPEEPKPDEAAKAEESIDGGADSEEKTEQKAETKDEAEPEPKGEDEKKTD